MSRRVEVSRIGIVASSLRCYSSFEEFCGEVCNWRVVRTWISHINVVTPPIFRPQSSVYVAHFLHQERLTSWLAYFAI